MYPDVALGLRTANPNPRPVAPSPQAITTSLTHQQSVSPRIHSSSAVTRLGYRFRGPTCWLQGFTIFDGHTSLASFFHTALHRAESEFASGWPTHSSCQRVESGSAAAFVKGPTKRPMKVSSKRYQRSQTSRITLSLDTRT